MKYWQIKHTGWFNPKVLNQTWSTDKLNLQGDSFQKFWTRHEVRWNLPVFNLSVLHVWVKIFILNHTVCSTCQYFMSGSKLLESKSFVPDIKYWQVEHTGWFNIKVLNQTWSTDKLNIQGDSIQKFWTRHEVQLYKTTCQHYNNGSPTGKWCSTRKNVLPSTFPRRETGQEQKWGHDCALRHSWINVSYSWSFAFYHNKLFTILQEASNPVRPVSLTSICSKLMEHILHSNIRHVTLWETCYPYWSTARIQEQEIVWIPAYLHGPWTDERTITVDLSPSTITSCLRFCKKLLIQLRVLFRTRIVMQFVD
jgi:hypothetical protein